MPTEGDGKLGQRAGDLRHQLYRATALIWEVYGKALLLYLTGLIFHLAYLFMTRPSETGPSSSQQQVTCADATFPPTLRQPIIVNPPVS